MDEAEIIDWNRWKSVKSIEIVEEGRSWCLAMDENEASWSLCDGWKWSSRMDENEVRGKFWERKGNEVIKLIKEGYYWKEI